MEKLFYYDPSSPSGLRHACAKGRTRKQGDAAGSINSNGYWQVTNKKRVLRVNRIVWELNNGPIPEGMMVEHIDQNPLNNLISNLRLATNGQNKQNCRVSKTKKHGLPKGVHKHRNGYQANIQSAGKVYTKKCATIPEAIEWLNVKRIELHGEFANTGD